MKVDGHVCERVSASQVHISITDHEKLTLGQASFHFKEKYALRSAIVDRVLREKVHCSLGNDPALVIVLLASRILQSTFLSHQQPLNTHTTNYFINYDLSLFIFFIAHKTLGTRAIEHVCHA